jgi:hypothetical protein
MYFNLDGKRTNEVLVLGGYGFCGATGNCSFWIFKKAGGRYREILETHDLIEVNDLGDQILRSTTKGYNDILVKSHLSSSDTGFTTYRYNGQKYVLYADLVSASHRRRNGEVYWKFIPSHDYWDRDAK